MLLLSCKGKFLAHMNLKISPGFKLYGLINILGIEAQCEVSVSLPFKVKVRVELMPIKLAKGALVLAKGRDDLTKGPEVAVGISPLGVSHY